MGGSKTKVVTGHQLLVIADTGFTAPVSTAELRDFTAIVFFEASADADIPSPCVDRTSEPQKGCQ